MRPVSVLCTHVQCNGPRSTLVWARPQTYAHVLYEVLAHGSRMLCTRSQRFSWGPPGTQTVTDIYIYIYTDAAEHAAELDALIL